MCTVSMVMDHFRERFDRSWPTVHPGWLEPVQKLDVPPSMVEEMRQLLKDFREAVEKAKRVDELTRQPDCVDAEKAQLIERVALLEKMVAHLLKDKANA